MRQNEEKRFQRVKEDFTCFNCGAEVKGTGYTDHCPKCLWSLHVDNNPGDRASGCDGKMKPTGVFYDGKNYIIYYACLSCKEKKNFTAAGNDDKEALLSFLNSS